MYCEERTTSKHVRCPFFLCDRMQVLHYTRDVTVCLKDFKCQRLPDSVVFSPSEMSNNSLPHIYRWHRLLVTIQLCDITLRDRSLL